MEKIETYKGTNIEKDIISKLTSLGYNCFLSNVNLDEVEPTKATHIFIGSYHNGEDFQFYGKDIKLPTKKVVDVEYVLNILNKNNVYKDFSKYFSKLLKKELGYENNINVYPTTYGIGIFVLFNFRTNKSKIQSDIESVLKKYDIEYKTEYSSAGWVFRYKISKCEQNIEKIKNVLNQL